jgi:predicted DNA-binding protein (MmcQ/YjbR family)
MPQAPPHPKAVAALRRAALAYPETREDHPWGESAFKVRGKVFVFLFQGEGHLALSMKLPQSRDFALLLPFAQPTGYGLGKSGWITATFGPKDALPLPLLLDWMDESFRAVAPRRLVRDLPAQGDPAPARKRR